MSLQSQLVCVLHSLKSPAHGLRIVGSINRGLNLSPREASLSAISAKQCNHFTSIQNEATKLQTTPTFQTGPRRMRLSLYSSGCEDGRLTKVEGLLASQFDISRLLYSKRKYKDLSLLSEKPQDLSLLMILDLMGIQEASFTTNNGLTIRLPSALVWAPISAPASAYPLPPRELPAPECGAARAVVEPCEEDLLPRVLPQHRSQRGISKQAITMIIIRRKKMKKHKRRKERKRNRVSHEHRILMDIIRREKTFQSEQVALVRAGDAFNAEAHVKGILEKFNYRPIPKFWRGKRLPQNVVSGLMLKAGLHVPRRDDGRVQDIPGSVTPTRKRPS